MWRIECRGGQVSGEWDDSRRVVCGAYYVLKKCGESSVSFRVPVRI